MSTTRTLAGQIVHACIAALLTPPAGNPTDFDRPDPSDDAIASAVDATLGRRRDMLPPRIRSEVDALVRVFVRKAMCPEPWQCVAAELDLGTGIADLVWTDGASWRIDEIKTGDLASHASRAAVAEQLERLLRAGHARWGDAFAGVRLIALADAEVVRSIGSPRVLAAFVSDAAHSVIRPGRGHTPVVQSPVRRSHATVRRAHLDLVRTLGDLRVAYAFAAADGLVCTYQQFVIAARDLETLEAAE